MAITLTNDQQKTFTKVQEFFGDEENPAIVIMGSAGTGKCLAQDTPVIMFDGSMRMVQNIRRGEEVMGDDSTPRRVTSVTSGIGKLCRVTTGFGDDFIVNEDHILTLRIKKTVTNDNMLIYGDNCGRVVTKEFKNRQAANYFSDQLPELVDISLKKCIDGMKDPGWSDVFHASYAKLSFPERKIDHNPYLVGAWLSGVYRSKFKNGIPPEYIYNTYEIRLKLLAGIIDSNGLFTDNYCDLIHDKIFYTDIVFLLGSLGYRAHVIKYSSEHNFFTLRFRGKLHEIPTVYKKTNTTLTESLCTTLTLTEIGEGIYYGFQLDGNGRFVLGNFVITHNTTLTKYIVDYTIDKLRINTVAIAPTHKARRVLSKMLNKDRFLPVPSLTVASILGKMKEHSYIGSKKYTKGSKQKMDCYDCFILDEVSMVADSDLEEIIDYVCTFDKKLILIGDNCQIPAPSQALIKENGVCYKPDSTAFDIENICELKTIVRQAKDSPIITMATYLRDHLSLDLDLPDILYNSKLDSSEICISRNDLYKSFYQDRKLGMDTRIVAYTNAAVRSHNEKIRKDMGFRESLLEGEILTGYSNVGFPTPLIENGTDYTVALIREKSDYVIGSYDELVGKMVDLIDMDDKTHISRGLFFIDVRNTSNFSFMKELVKRAEKVNRRYSTKNDYKKYCSMKNRAVFLEDVYNFAGTVMSETNFRQLHPLLFTKVSDVIDTVNKYISVSELTKKIEDQYGDIIEGRLSDNKGFADGEVFADQFMVVSKDIYYGYASTAHKVQGSTYDSVYVDEHDFKKIQNRWNYKFRAEEMRCKERNQLKYVAYTRASKKLRIVI